MSTRRWSHDPNTSRNAKTPCGYLINNKTCTTAKCDFSHDTRLVGRWQSQLDETKACRWGDTCLHNQDGNCFFYHPPEHQLTRPTMAISGLKYLESLDLNTLVVDRDVRIEDEFDLGSYNKLSDDEIIVPGSPPRFHPLVHRAEVKLDAHNESLISRFPAYTHIFEPLLRSTEICTPGYNIYDSAEIVCSASSLRKLFHFFSKEKHRVVERYDLEMRRGTLFIAKWQDDPSLQLSAGHGAGFERETCRYPYGEDIMIRTSASHHRVVRYRFGGLDCVVQSEVDAYHCECGHPVVASSVRTPPASALVPAAYPGSKCRGSGGSNEKDPIEKGEFTTPRRRRRSSASTTSTQSYRNQTPSRRTSLPTSPSIFKFSALPLDDPGDSPSLSTSPPSHPPGVGKLKIHHLGRHIPSPCLLEVKTSRADVPVPCPPEAQLYFSRRRQLYTATHRAGVFIPDGERAKLEDKTTDLNTWEAEHAVVLGKMAALLRMLWRRVRELGREGVEGVTLVIESDGSVSRDANSQGAGVRGLKAGLYIRGDVRGLVP